MNSTIAFLLGGLLLLVWVGILLVFKEFCLDKIKSGVWKYSLGMMFAYGILLLLYVASEHYLSLKLVALIQEAALSINWSWMLDFVACCGLIVLIVWLDHKKHSSKSKRKE